MKIEKDSVEKAIIERLKSVIDPETGVNVIRMRLVQNLVVSEDGKVSYQFRPSSPLCPIAIPLTLAILQVIGEVEGVSGQDISVIDYIEADKLNQLLKSATNG
jgi:metal-sulfur cluster biosynthetic enzyme